MDSRVNAGVDARSRLRARGSLAILLSAATSALVAGCASSGGPAVLEAEGLTAAVYDPDGSSFDILAEGVLVDVGSGCLGIERTSDHEKLIVAFPSGSALSGDGTISVEGGGTLAVGDTVQYTGSDDTRETTPRVPLTIPEACPGDLDIWYFPAERQKTYPNGREVPLYRSDGETVIGAFLAG